MDGGRAGEVDGRGAAVERAHRETDAAVHADARLSGVRERGTGAGCPCHLSCGERSSEGVQ